MTEVRVLCIPLEINDGGGRSTQITRCPCSGPKLICLGNFIMVLHGFASRIPKNNVFWTPRCKTMQNDLDSNVRNSTKSQTSVMSGPTLHSIH